MRQDEIRDYWDTQAETFDEEPDHGLRDPAVADAWRALLVQHLPAPPASLADLGCGTGSLALLLAELGHQVDGIDLSPEMVARAEAKAVDVTPRPRFAVGDAAAPGLGSGRYDAVVVRHVTWALPDPVGALERWSDLLKPAGRLLLVEGFWSTGGGLHASELQELVSSTYAQVEVHPLPQERYWGRPITDERYLLTALKPQP